MDRREFEDAIEKLKKLTLKDQEFVVNFIKEAHRQEQETPKKRPSSKPILKRGSGEIVTDTKGDPLYVGDRVEILSGGTVEGIKFHPGDKGYFTGFKGDYCIIHTDKQKGRVLDHIRRIERYVNKISDE